MTFVDAAMAGSTTIINSYDFTSLVLGPALLDKGKKRLERHTRFGADGFLHHVVHPLV